MRVPGVNGFLQHAAFGVVRNGLHGFAQSHPLRLDDLVVVIGGLAAGVFHQVEFHDFFNALATPIHGTRVPVLDGGKSSHGISAAPGFLASLSAGSFFGCFSVLDCAFWEAPRRVAASGCDLNQADLRSIWVWLEKHSPRGGFDNRFVQFMPMVNSDGLPVGRCDHNMFFQ